MPDVDPLAFDIRFALKHEAIGASARRFIRLLPDAELDFLCRQVAAYLPHSRWARQPPEQLAATEQGPMTREERTGDQPG